MWHELRQQRRRRRRSGRWCAPGRPTTRDGNADRDEYLAWIEEQTGAELSDFFDGWLLAEAVAEVLTLTVGVC